MKSTLLKILNVALLMVCVFAVAQVFCPNATAALLTSALPAGVAHYLIGHPASALAFSPLVTQFSSDLSTNLFPDNAFYKRSKDDKEFITANGAEVSLPQAGSLPGVTKNRTQLPATVSQRPDTAIKYALDEFTTDPILVQNTEELVVNYKKRENILEDHKDKLITEIANNFLYRWAPDAGSAAILRTTGVTDGSAAKTRKAGAPGATGTRKRTSEEDMINMFNFFNNQNTPLEGRCAVMTPDMYADLLGIDSFKLLQLIGTANQITGKINTLYSFDIYLRTGGLVYDVNGVLKAAGAASATTDNLASLFWHERFVRRAEGEVKVLANTGDNGEGDPTYFGGIYSALVRAGGSKAREDGAGVAVLVQGN